MLVNIYHVDAHIRWTKAEATTATNIKTITNINIKMSCDDRTIWELTFRKKVNMRITRK